MNSKGRGTERREADYYPTPHAAYEPLSDIIPKGAVILEPACGDGRIVRYFRTQGYQCNGYDLHEYDYVCNVEQRDFLTDAMPSDWTVTNPPFSLAQEFIEHAIEISKHVMFLLRLDFLGTTGRHRWWIEHAPQALFVLSARPGFIPGAGTDYANYAWYYWGPLLSGMHWIIDPESLQRADADAARKAMADRQLPLLATDN